MSKNAEKVTPDAKISKSSTSSSLTTSVSDGVDVACNLADRLESAASDPTEGGLMGFDETNKYHH